MKSRLLLEVGFLMQAVVDLAKAFGDVVVQRVQSVHASATSCRICTSLWLEQRGQLVDDVLRKQL